MTKGVFNWGVIGTGGIANAFARDIQKLDGHRVTAVLSRSTANANSFAANLNSCKSFVDMEKFLDEPNVDSIYIATPNTLHCKQTIDSLNAKIPVLCEKPFAMNGKEAELMIKTAKKNKVTLLDGMWMRYLPHIEIIKQIISNGKIGKIESLFACHGQNLKRIDNPRLWTKELGGGALLDLGIYVVSLAHMVLGSPKEIIAQSIFTDQGVDAKTSVIFDYDSGIIATLICSMYDAQPNRAIISGSKGYIDIEPTFYAPTTIKLYTNDGQVIPYPNNYDGHGLREQALEMEKCKINNQIESEKMPHAESLSVMNSMDRIRAQIGLEF